jgi:hypothetical protein
MLGPGILTGGDYMLRHECMLGHYFVWTLTDCKELDVWLGLKCLLIHELHDRSLLYFGGGC